jgi:hypothetical protein
MYVLLVKLMPFVAFQKKVGTVHGPSKNILVMHGEKFLYPGERNGNCNQLIQGNLPVKSGIYPESVNNHP